MTGNSNYWSMLCLIYVALPFLVFAITNLEPFSKLIHQHTDDSMSHSVSGVLWFVLHFWYLIIFYSTRCAKSQQPCPLPSLPSPSVSLFFSHHLFCIIYFSCLISFCSTHFLSTCLVLCFYILFCFVFLSVCFCPCVLLSVPSPPLLLGYSAAATWTWETTCCPEGTAGPAEVPVRPDPVFAATAPAAAWRAEETENSRCNSGHSGMGSEKHWKMDYKSCDALWYWCWRPEPLGKSGWEF